jgi:hypothetical protein
MDKRDLANGGGRTRAHPVAKDEKNTPAKGNLGALLATPQISGN